MRACVKLCYNGNAFQSALSSRRFFLGVSESRRSFLPPSVAFPFPLQSLTVTPMDLRSDLQFAVELARGAGRIVLDHFGKVDRLTKRHAEAVTEADRAAQRHIV